MQPPALPQNDTPRHGPITQALIELGQGEQEALKRLLPLVYDELKGLARGHRFKWQGGQNIPGTTSLVHEAYLKLVDQTQVNWQNRAHFFYYASRTMRSILVDNARRYQRQKRAGERKAVPLDDVVLVSEERSEELLALDEALSRLQEQDERIGKIVECRFFGGLSVEETADTLSISPATVKRGWNVARSWLYRELQPESDS